MGSSAPENSESKQDTMKATLEAMVLTLTKIKDAGFQRKLGKLLSRALGSPTGKIQSTLTTELKTSLSASLLKHSQYFFSQYNQNMNKCFLLSFKLSFPLFHLIQHIIISISSFYFPQLANFLMVKIQCCSSHLPFSFFSGFSHLIAYPPFLFM